MVSYHLWGSASGLARSQLSDALQTTELLLGDVLDYLAREGLVRVDADSGTVRLSDAGARALLVHCAAVPRCAIAFPSATWH